MESQQDIDRNKKQKFDIQKTQQRRLNELFNPIVKESAKSKLENHAVSLRKKTRNSKILRKNFHEFVKNKQSQSDKQTTSEENKSANSRTLSLQELFDRFEKLKDVKFDELDEETKGLIYLVDYQVKDIKNLSLFLQNENEIFWYIAVFGIRKILLHLYLLGKDESFSNFYQHITEHSIIDKMTMVLINTT